MLVTLTPQIIWIISSIVYVIIGIFTSRFILIARKGVEAEKLAFLGFVACIFWPLIGGGLLLMGVLIGLEWVFKMIGKVLALILISKVPKDK